MIIKDAKIFENTSPNGPGGYILETRIQVPDDLKPSQVMDALAVVLGADLQAAATMAAGPSTSAAPEAAEAAPKPKRRGKAKAAPAEEEEEEEAKPAKGSRRRAAKPADEEEAEAPKPRRRGKAKAAPAEEEEEEEEAPKPRRRGKAKAAPAEEEEDDTPSMEDVAMCASHGAEELGSSVMVDIICEYATSGKMEDIPVDKRQEFIDEVESEIALPPADEED